MKHRKHRILALLTSGAAAISLLSAMPVPAAAEAVIRTMQQTMPDPLTQVTASRVEAVKTKFCIPEDCREFQFFLPDSTLASLAANKLGMPEPEPGTPLTPEQLAEALGSSFAADILPDPERWEKTGEGGFAYTFVMNENYDYQKDSAAKLIVYMDDKGARNYMVRLDFVAVTGSLAQIGDYKRIDGLHQLLSQLPVTTQFYYNSETGSLLRVSETGKAGMSLCLSCSSEAVRSKQKAHLAALAAGFFGPGCKIEDSPIYIAYDSAEPTAPVMTNVTYEITVPKQSAELENSAKAFIQMLVREGQLPQDCKFYPEYGKASTVTPVAYNNNAGKKEAIEAYLAENAPEYSLDLADNNTKIVLRKTDAVYESATPVYMQIYNDLGIFPDEIAVAQETFHAFGTELKPDLSAAEPQLCTWESPYGKDDRDTAYYSTFTRFVSGNDSYTELYKKGGALIGFRAWDNYIAFHLKDESAISKTELDKLIKEASGLADSSFYIQQNGEFCVVQVHEKTISEQAVSAIKKALTDKALISTFYGPRDVATFRDFVFTFADDGSFFYFKDGLRQDQKRFAAAAEWLTEYHSEIAFEDDYADRDVSLGRTDTSYFKVTPTVKLSEQETLDLICELHHILNTFPREDSINVQEAVYAVRNNCLEAEPETTGSCEWISPIGWGTENAYFWKNLKKIETCGMYGNDVYINDAGMMYAFVPENSLACIPASDINTTTSQIVGQIERIAKPYYVSAEDNLVRIYQSNGSTPFPEADAARIKKELMEAGLIEAFFENGNVATVTQATLGQNQEALYYYTAKRQKDDVFLKMEAWLKGNRPGYTITIVDGYEIGRTDTAYIKVIPDKEVSAEEMYTVAGALYAETKKSPQFNVMLPNRPVYAVRNDALSVRGDMNLDGTADVADAVMIARYAAEDNELVITDKGRRNADLQDDGNVDSKDLTLLLRAIAKQIKL